MTARQIIEARLGRKLPATRDLPRDLRTAIKTLAIQLLKARDTMPAWRCPHCCADNHRHPDRCFNCEKELT